VQRRELVHQGGQVLLVHAVVQYRDLRIYTINKLIYVATL
jgi:hypothetical protein